MASPTFEGLRDRNASLPLQIIFKVFLRSLSGIRYIRKINYEQLARRYLPTLFFTKANKKDTESSALEPIFSISRARTVFNGITTHLTANTCDLGSYIFVSHLAQRLWTRRVFGATKWACTSGRSPASVSLRRAKMSCVVSWSSSQAGTPAAHCETARCKQCGTT